MSDYVYMGCPVADVLPDGSCSVPLQAVLPAPVPFPALSMSDGAAISAAICAVWAVGFVIRLVRQHIERLT